jgi:hypothetical protein
MKGIIFTVFIDMLEEDFGLATADSVLSSASIPAERAYTAVGNYPAEEMFALLGQTAALTGKPVEGLVDRYCVFLLKALLSRHGALIGNLSGTFALLESLNNHIHVQVKKLYPDAELPHFTAQRINEHRMELLYASPRKMELVASGLIKAAAQHFNETVHIEMEHVENGVKFYVTK